MNLFPPDDIFDDDADKAKPFGGIAKVGPSRWYWVYWRTRKARYDGQDPDAHGSADSRKDAIKKCGGIETFLGSPDFPPIFDDDFSGVHFNRKEAFEWRSIFAARRRKPNLKASPDVHVIEFVYHDTLAWDDFGNFCGGHPHRILKKTTKRIFIERDCHGRRETMGGVSRVPTFSLDRVKLEAGETIYPEHYAGASGFCLSAPEETEPQIPECFVALGLRSIPTLAQLKRVGRRLFKKHHPDVGGDRDKFRRVREHYEAALALIKAND